MRFFTTLGVIFYATVISIISLFIILFSLQIIIINPVDVSNITDIISQDLNLRYALLFVGILLFIVSISFAQIILGKIERERSIAFQNPSGPVIISVAAIEDLIKRLTNSIFEIKESRPEVVKRKKDLEVYLRIILKHETNIPDLASKLQELIKSKIQEILRVDDPIVVKIHVQKIISAEEKKKKETREQENVPFQGYRNI
jgi:uncharacterized alkaline shock family protein YloU